MSAATLSMGAPALGRRHERAGEFSARVLPWATSAADEQRFWRIARAIGLVMLVLGIALPFIPRPQKPLDRIEPLPAPMAKLLIERKAPPPPVAPPKPEAVAAAPKPEATPEPARPEPAPRPRATRPEQLKAAPVPEARNPVEGKPPGEAAIDVARRQAMGVGLLAMKAELSQMAAGAPLAAQLRKDIPPGPGVGTGSGPGVGAGTEAGLPSRALLTAAGGRAGSGGINTAAYSRDSGGGGLAGRSTTLVEGVASGGGGGGPGGGGGGRTGGTGVGAGGGAGNSAVAKGGSGKASRSIEEIKLVFERNKGAIYSMYQRALRDDPTLQGKVVLELKIAPSGEVLACRVLSSELKNADLENKLRARVQGFDFGAKDVAEIVVSWPVDFLPS
jgi:outer membrane biosynthesis protein TonB